MRAMAASDAAVLFLHNHWTTTVTSRQPQARCGNSGMYDPSTVIISRSMVIFEHVGSEYTTTMPHVQRGRMATPHRVGTTIESQWSSTTNCKQGVLSMFMHDPSIDHISRGMVLFEHVRSECTVTIPCEQRGPMSAPHCDDTFVESQWSSTSSCKQLASKM